MISAKKFKNKLDFNHGLSLLSKEISLIEEPELYLNEAILIVDHRNLSEALKIELENIGFILNCGTITFKFHDK